MLRTLFLLSASTAILSTAATAQDSHHHHHGHDHNHGSKNKTGFYGDIDLNVYTSDIFDAEESNEEGLDVFTHSHGTIGYGFGNKFSINSTLSLEGEPIGHAHGGGAARTPDQVFDETSLFIEELTLNYDADEFGVHFGKFNPAAGIDLHDVPGWWGPLVFEEFEIRERLGFGGYALHEFEDIGEHRLDLSTYFADTSFLQETAFYDRETIDKQDGGSANTENFSSLSARLSGEIGHSPARYYIGYTHQGTKQNSEKDEKRFIFGAQGAFNLTHDTALSVMGDVTDIKHLGGESDHDRRYSTLGAELSYQNWSLGGTHTHIKNKASDADENIDGSISQFSVGYNWNNGFETELGYLRGDEEGEVTKRGGLLVKYNTQF